MDPSTATGVLSVSTGEALMFVGTAIGSAIAAIKGHKYYQGRSKPLSNGRLDAALSLMKSQAEFATNMRDFTVHVQEQHGNHAEQLKEQTRILSEISRTLAGCHALLQNR